jgi:hypothetical protein
MLHFDNWKGLGDIVSPAAPQLLDPERKWIDVQVYHYGAPLKAFTVIKARPSTSWGYTGEMVSKCILSQIIISYFIKTAFCFLRNVPLKISGNSVGQPV